MTTWSNDFVSILQVLPLEVISSCKVMNMGLVLNGYLAMIPTVSLCETEVISYIRD